MKKVYQTIISPTKGNCMQAAIASLLDLDLKDVPNFIQSEDYTYDFNTILKSRNVQHDATLYNYNEKNSISEYTTLHELSECNGINGYFYASVYSPAFTDVSKTLEEVRTDYKSVTHAVICDKCFNIVHDPNPNNKNITKYPFADELGFNGIINILVIEFI